MLKGFNAHQSPRVDPPTIGKYVKKEILPWRPLGTKMYKSVEKAIRAMALVEKECMEVQRTVDQLPPNPSTSSLSSSRVQQEEKKKTMMVGVDDALFEMKSMLTSERRDLQVIPIVGMGGTGKTTLALNIFQDCLIAEHFDIRAWVTVSQEYNTREILMHLLTPLVKEVLQDLSEGALGEVLYKHLFGRRYLIIMDDIWSIGACDIVKRFLPDNNNCSRIVITTRLSDLGAKLNTSSSLEMKLLNEVDSWELLSRTVFGGKGCPRKLEETGKKIGSSCKGLPLSIVVVGGLLAKSEQTSEFWEYIEKNINAVVNLEDNERCLKILYTSYKHVPVHLKPCFLYMGVFREDKEIYIPRVVKLWVAEGFLKPISGKSLEEVARVYIKDLADRNLIVIDKIGRSGNIKQCRVHDLLRDLSLREAEKQRFYTWVTSPQGQYCRHMVVPSFLELSRVALSAFTSPLVRSLTCYGGSEGRILPQLGVSLLRVLDSHEVTPKQEVHRLVNSRFLDLSSNIRSPLPSSIWQFWNLQTLFSLMYEDGCFCATIPSGIWHMPHIRHLHFPRGVHLPDPPPPGGQDDVVLGNLQTLEIAVSFTFSEQVVKRIPNIKKLKISYLSVVDDDMYCLRNLDRLHKLGSLYCTFMQGMNPSGVDSTTGLIKFPHSLKKLTLCMNKKVCTCGENILDKIGALPLLENLRLYEWSFNGGQWETTEGQFRSLKFLLLNRCEGLTTWTTESSHFPCLERLSLLFANDMEEIPLDFAYVTALQSIYVQGCSDFVVVSAKRILEEQEEFHGEEGALHVQVNVFRGNEELLHLMSPNFHFIWK